MRLLAHDHYFAQDIDALRGALEPGDHLDVVSFDVFRSEAMRVLPEEVGTNLEPFTRPDHAAAREEWARRLRTLLEELWMRHRFDAFVSPSDTFFYLRAAPAPLHDLGVPFVCVQKETTISPFVMRALVEDVRDHAPPIADLTTVCSERNREFWVKAGAAPETVHVTGQPRFDVYGRRPATVLPFGEGGPVVLFFSYMREAYHPKEFVGGAPGWQALHEQTEDGLWELARRGWRVLIKPHPQQPFAEERRRIARAAGPLLDDRVFLVDPLHDTRELILGSDVLVGFLTTALIESLAARKPVVYTGWDPEAHAVADDLIPFHRWGDVLDVVTDAAALADTVVAARERTWSPAQDARADEIVAEHLGPVDGHAAERALALIRGQVEAFAAARDPEVEGRRDALAARRPPLGLGRKARAGVRRLRATVSGLGER